MCGSKITEACLIFFPHDIRYIIKEDGKVLSTQLSNLMAFRLEQGELSLAVILHIQPWA